MYHVVKTHMITSATRSPATGTSVLILKILPNANIAGFPPQPHVHTERHRERERERERENNQAMSRIDLLVLANNTLSLSETSILHVMY